MQDRRGPRMQEFIKASYNAGDTPLFNNSKGPGYIREERENKGSGAPEYRRRAPGAEPPSIRRPGLRGTRQTTTPLAGVTEVYTLVQKRIREMNKIEKLLVAFCAQ